MFGSKSYNMRFQAPFGYGGNALQLQSRIWVQPNTNESEPHSDIEYRALKKPRVSDLASDAKMNVAMNREMRHRFIKTQLCEKFNMGNCPYGDKCIYAHGIREIREAGHFDKTWNDGSNAVKCWMFHVGGKCTYGDRCRFLHHVPEKRLESSSRLREDPCATVVNPEPVICKTRLCTKWGLPGGCRFGKTCRFAHGQAELQKSCYYPSSAAESRNVKHKSVDAPRDTVLASPVISKCLIKWQVVGKIDGIYADWIDDA